MSQPAAGNYPVPPPLSIPLAPPLENHWQEQGGRKRPRVSFQNSPRCLDQMQDLCVLLGASPRSGCPVPAVGQCHFTEAMSRGYWQGAWDAHSQCSPNPPPPHTSRHWRPLGAGVRTGEASVFECLLHHLLPGPSAPPEVGLTHPSYGPTTCWAQWPQASVWVDY